MRHRQKSNRIIVSDGDAMRRFQISLTILDSKPGQKEHTKHINIYDGQCMVDVDDMLHFMMRMMTGYVNRVMYAHRRELIDKINKEAK